MCLQIHPTCADEDFFVDTFTRHVVTTACGMKMIADDVVSATCLEGDRLIADSSAQKWQNGIAVKASSLATSAPDVYALGYCTSTDGKRSRFI